jgi:hypothetical protein
MIGDNTQIETSAPIADAADGNAEYAPFLNALAADGLYTDKTQKFPWSVTTSITPNTGLGHLSKIFTTHERVTNIELEFK